jgi:hypothetical protein
MSKTPGRQIQGQTSKGQQGPCPIKGPGLGDLSVLPRWIGQVYDLNFPEHFTTLIRVLEDRSRRKRVPVMAPTPPVDFVKRPAEFDALKRQLLDAKGDATAVTAAFRGAGGYGAGVTSGATRMLS